MEETDEVLYDNTIAMFREDETEYQIDIVDYNLNKDLAIVKFVTMPAQFNVAQITSADQHSIGDTAIIVGNAAGLGVTASVGIISETPQLYEVDYMDEVCEAIRTDSAVNPGNSGGGIFNDEGNLIGIVTFKLVEPYENLGFALTTNFATDYIDAVEIEQDIEIDYTEV